MDNVQRHGGGFVGGLLGRLFSSVEDPHPDLSSDAVKNYLKNKRKELKDVIDANARGEGDYDLSGVSLRSEIEGYLDSLKARGEKKAYKVWKKRVEDLDRYS